jgi:hypothetical protein
LGPSFPRHAFNLFGFDVRAGVDADGSRDMLGFGRPLGRVETWVKGPRLLVVGAAVARAKDDNEATSRLIERAREQRLVLSHQFCKFRFGSLRR